MREWIKNYGALMAFYILVRALSFLLRNHADVQVVLAAVLIGAFGYYCIKNISFAWQLLMVELLLDGAGHFFELRGLLLRTWLLGIFAVCWAWKKLRAHTKIVWPKKNILIALGVFSVFLAWSIINGFILGNSPKFIVQDAMLYLFILLLFPALEFEGEPRPIYAAAAKIFIFGSAIFSVITLALYSTHVFILQDAYYHWFRDVAAGKITDLGMNFFRIVTAEQILFVPIILIILSQLIKKIQDKKMWLLLAASLLIIILNFTRIYFVALVVGGFFLLRGAPWKQWLRVMSITCVLAALIFFSTHLIASRGLSSGLELLGVRVAGIKAPETDISGVIRMALLPDIFAHITTRPLLGSGLGTTITYLDPLTNTNQTRTQFDWGYFEMLAELGALGTLAYITLLGIIMYECKNRALIAGAAALFVINITTPALFQGFGVLYFAMLASCLEFNNKTQRL